MRNRHSFRLPGLAAQAFRLWALSLPLSVLAADDRPATLAAAGGNPLALNAMAFLGWYWKLFLLLALITIAVRWVRWMPDSGTGDSAMLGDDPYLMAYLTGSRSRVVEAVLASLLQQGALRINAVNKELISEDEVPEARPQIERSARALLDGTRQVASKVQFQRWMQQGLSRPLTIMHRRLLRAGLLARPALQAWARLPLAVGFALLFGIGLIRMIAGVGNGRPVGFLILSMLVMGFAVFWLLRGMAEEAATPAGKRLLKDLGARLGRGGDDRVWMVALLGLSGFGLGSMADLGYLIHELPRNGLFGGLGQTRGDRGSTGGGSCGGGCGGGGCGGGGCGGCGG